MSAFHLTMADNVASLRKWHDRKRQGPWASCVWEPCDQTETQFREVWSNADHR